MRIGYSDGMTHSSVKLNTGHRAIFIPKELLIIQMCLLHCV